MKKIRKKLTNAKNGVINLCHDIKHAWINRPTLKELWFGYAPELGVAIFLIGFIFFIASFTHADHFSPTIQNAELIPRIAGIVIMLVGALALYTKKIVQSKEQTIELAQDPTT